MTVEDIKSFEHFHISEQLVKVLSSKNRSKEKLFFRVLVAYYFAKIASIMRVQIDSPDRGQLPINMYALSLATSGFGKGMSINLIEDKVLAGFKKKFIDTTMPIVSSMNLDKLAIERAAKFKLEYDDVYAGLEREYNSTGTYLFSFDSGTSSAIKQLRHQLLLANIGSINLEMDEVGANLSANTDILNTFIELYDVGKVKAKITKNTAENKRNTDLDGRTPANMLLFGTPSKLLDGSRAEDDFFSMLEMGYARRLLFAYVPKVKKDASLTAEEIYDMMTDTSSDAILTTLATHITGLADKAYYNKVMRISKPTAIEIINYSKLCEDRASKLKEHQELLKAEFTHRYFKAMKLAGAYAFIDGSPEITMDHVKAAIKLVEESGTAFTKILSREKPYVKLAKYIAELETDLTHVDLVEDLPFYKGSEAARRDLLNLAIAYGYKNNIIIKKSYVDGIEFLRGESLKETNLNEMIIAYSDHFTEGYNNDHAPFADFGELIHAPGMHFTAHHWKENYRLATNAIMGFNQVILDIDEGCTIATAQELLKDFTYTMYTTKSHKVEKSGKVCDRFRVILPMSHIVKLGKPEYEKFMENIIDWLPFAVDEQAVKDIARKWETNPSAEIYTNQGELLNVMDFIPQTKKAEEMAAQRAAIGSLSSLEAWFYRKIGEGNRNNLLLRYALCLTDNGYSLENISNAVMAFNDKLKNPLSRDEIYSSIIVTVTKKIHG